MDSLVSLVSEIASIFNKDFDFAFKERIKRACIGYRATLAKQEFDKNGRWSTGLIDPICLPVISVPKIECCLNDEIQCSVRRTKNKVPAPIRTNRFPDPFVFVGTSNQEKAFTYTTPEVVSLVLSGNKFTNKMLMYSYFGDYIYLYNYEGGKIHIRAPFANPFQLLELENCDGNPCIEEIQIEEDLKSTIKRMVLEEFGVTKRIPKDNEIRLNEPN